MGYWDDLAHHIELDGNWMNHPLVRERINLRVTGDRHTWPTTWLKMQSGGRAPLRRTASIGSGVGNFERDIVRQEIVANVTGIDASVSCIARAKEIADDEGYSSAITYVSGDAREWLRNARDLEAVFFHQSLHHFDLLEELMKLVRAALRPGGILYIDEYIGPSRDEWHMRDLALHNFLYYRLPKAVRRVRVIRAPINREDPTEAVQSSKIMRAIESEFDILTRRDYGGNVLAVMYPNLNWMEHSPEQAARISETVEFLLDVEDVILRHPKILRASGSFYTVAIATPKR
jgi:SAM-dependent methyltransferase